MTNPLRTAALQLRTARRVVRGRTPTLRGAAGPLEERMVFVFGSPRSGTTFLAGAIASTAGFVDLGEVAALKASIPGLAGEPVETAAARIRRTLAVTCRLGLVTDLRAVEQTPEAAFVAPDSSYATLGGQGAVLAFAQTAMAPDAEGAVGAPAGSEVWIEAEDVPAALARAVAAGAEPVQEPVVKPWGQTVAYVRDPNGTLIELGSPVAG